MRTLAITLALLLSSSAVALAQECDLRMESNAPEHSDPDTDVSFQLTVTNGGPDPADGVQLDDPLPPTMTFVSLAAAGGWSCTTPAVGVTGTVTCTIAQLAANAPALFTVVGHIPALTPAGTFFTNIASVTTTTPDVTSENDSSTANVQTPPPPAADLLVAVEGVSATNANRDVSYKLTISNGSPNDAATHVALSVDLPGDMVFQALTQTSGPVFTCGLAGQQITCTIASLPGGASGLFTLVGHVPNGTFDGTTYQLLPRVTSDYDPNTENDETSTLFCVQANSCSAGPCNNNVAVVCPSDQCNDAGTCNSVSGLCAPSTPRTGNACDDGDACTQTDLCQAGVCQGTNPVECSEATSCQTQGTCDPATGQCGANVNLPDLSACDDDDGCTATDACSDGVCVGSEPVLCPSADACHQQGACDPATGECVENPARVDGTVCDDGDACTGASSCQAGVCTGSAPVVCAVPDPCHAQGTCDPATGTCAANPALADGTRCDDGSACTLDDVCAAGSCAGAARSCDDGDACTTNSCDPATGCVFGASVCGDASIAGAGGSSGSSGSAKDGGVGSAGRGPDDEAGASGGALRDAGQRDGGTADDADDGCDCRVGPGASAHPARALFAIAFALLLGGRLRSRKSRRR